MTEERPSYGLQTVTCGALIPQTFDDMMKQADVLVKSGLLPAGIKTPAAAVAVMLTGREMGIPTMQAFRQVYIVNGKPSFSAELIGALLQRAGTTIDVIELTEEKCTLKFSKLLRTSLTFSVTMEEAKRGKWDSEFDKDKGEWRQKHTWRAHPKSMLFSRCLSMGGRKFDMAAVNNMYTPEELGADVDVDEAGQIVTVTPTIIVEGKPAPGAEPAPATTQKPPAASEQDHTLPVGDIEKVNAAHAAYTTLQGVDPRVNGHWLKGHLTKHWRAERIADLDNAALDAVTWYMQELAKIVARTDGDKDADLKALKDAYEKMAAEATATA